MPDEHRNNDPLSASERFGGGPLPDQEHMNGPEGPFSNNPVEVVQGEEKAADGTA